MISGKELIRFFQMTIDQLDHSGGMVKEINRRLKMYVGGFPQSLNNSVEFLKRKKEELQKFDGCLFGFKVDNRSITSDIKPLSIPVASCPEVSAMMQNFQPNYFCFFEEVVCYCRKWAFAHV